jgi:transposase-like protein
MPKKIDPELRARAVRLMVEHRAEYPTETAAVVAVAKQLGCPESRCGVGRRRPGWMPVTGRV